MARRRTLDLTAAEKQACDAKMRGLSRAEIAAELNVTPQAIKKLWGRARKRLRDAQRGNYAAALSSPMRRVYLKPFSLLTTDHV
jgi:DNA-binding CsgD family transcriptional regulator